MAKSESECPYKEGYLWFPPHGVLTQLKKSWNKCYCKLFKSSIYGIERLEVLDDIENKKLSIIPLKSCVKITKETNGKYPSNVFAIWTKTSIYNFSANSEQEMNDWIYTLQIVAFTDNISSQTIEEDNDLYCSSGDAGVFSVKLISSDASKRCGLKEQIYTLVITSVSLQLWESDENNILLLTWPYRFIRRYSYKADRFTFEAGRKSFSGEGIFHFEHSNQQEIYNCITTKMKMLKELLINSNGVTSLKCDNNQLQATMIASSHNPPLNITNTSTNQLILDNDLLTISCSTKPLMPEPALLLNSQNVLPKKSIISKNLPASLKNEPCTVKTHATYEDVLIKNDTRTISIDDSNYLKKPDNNIVSDDSIENYDHLQHFGFISKRAPGYKQINPISLTSQHKPFITSNSLIMSARKADDSHYGYGTINKILSLDKNHSNDFLNSVFKSNKI